MTCPGGRTRHTSLGGVLLAAGGGERLGQPKQLLEIDGEPLVRRVAVSMQQLCGAAVIVVTGAYAERVERSLCELPVTVIRNPHWRRGLGGSLVRGLAASSADAVLVMVCDQTALEISDLQRLVDAWTKAVNHPAAASYAGVLGVPAIIPRKWFAALGALDGDSGAREFLRKHRKIVNSVSMPNAAADIDEPADLESA